MAKRKSKKGFSGASDLCVALSVLMGIAVFVMMFFTNIKETNSDKLVEFSDLFFGKTQSTSGVASLTITGTFLGFVAYLVVFIAAFFLVLVMLNKKTKYRKIMCFVLGLLMIAGGVVILFIPQLYAGVQNVVKTPTLSGGATTTLTDKVGTYTLTAMTITSGIVAIVGGVLSIFSLVANKLFK
ncbi:MAG: hypothetical protein MR766_03520 [Erysipelotrichaceae bacterium]|nr:hypothetical protein [Erysipelotrichaceae bacterium]